MDIELRIGKESAFCLGLGLLIDISILDNKPKGFRFYIGLATV